MPARQGGPDWAAPSRCGGGTGCPARVAGRREPGKSKLRGIARATNRPGLPVAQRHAGRPVAQMHAVAGCALRCRGARCPGQTATMAPARPPSRRSSRSGALSAATEASRFAAHISEYLRTALGLVSVTERGRAAGSAGSPGRLCAAWEPRSTVPAPCTEHPDLLASRNDPCSRRGRVDD